MPDKQIFPGHGSFATDNLPRNDFYSRYGTTAKGFWKRFMPFLQNPLQSLFPRDCDTREGRRQRDKEGDIGRASDEQLASGQCGAGFSSPWSTVHEWTTLTSHPFMHIHIYTYTLPLHVRRFLGITPSYVHRLSGALGYLMLYRILGRHHHMFAD